MEGTLVELINRLQILFSSLNPEVGIDNFSLFLDLPSVVVVGSQSTGKSSLLSALIGDGKILPTGPGMCTRCPLVIQLHHATAETVRQKIHTAGFPSALAEDFLAEFPNLKPDANGPASTFCLTREHIANTIEQLTTINIASEVNKENLSCKSVSSIPIIMKFWSPRVIDLTLIDLPGLIRVPTARQPPEIVDQINNLVLRYIKNTNTIILAVSAANVDLANSDALRLAREVDEKGQRTIGVLTKCDLVDDAESILQIVSGKVYPLRRGYVPVRCRSAEEVDLPHDQFMANELRFFKEHPILRKIKALCGTDQLALKLKDLLLCNIRLCLGNLKAKLDTLFNETEMELRGLGFEVDPNGRQAGALILGAFTAYTRTIEDLLSGRAELPKPISDNPAAYALSSCAAKWRRTTVTDESKLVGGARLHFLFQDCFARSVMQRDPLQGLQDREIQTAIRNASGSSSSLFVPENAFEMLVRRQIQKLESPVTLCVQQAMGELLSIIDMPLRTIAEFQRFPTLTCRVREICRELVGVHMTKTLQVLTDLIKIEMAFINKAHPDFVNGKRSITDFLLAAGAREHAGLPSPIRHGSIGSNGLVNPTTQFQAEQTGAEEPTSEGGQPPQTPSTAAAGGSDTEPSSRTLNVQQQPSFLAFWRRHPLQQTPVPPTGARPRLSALETTMNPTEPDCRAAVENQLELELVKSLITSYFNIVKKTMADLVPKAIMHFLVHAVRDNINQELVTTLYKEELFPVLLEEAAAIPAARQKAEARIQVLTEARKMFSSLQEMTQ